MSELRAAAELARFAKTAPGRLPSVVQDAIATIEAALAAEQPQNVEGPESLAPQPAPGLVFDARGVLVPAEQPQPVGGRCVAPPCRCETDGQRRVCAYWHPAPPAAASAEQPQPEPVAWYVFRDGEMTGIRTRSRKIADGWIAEGQDVRAVYLAPPPPAAAPTDAQDAARYRWLRDAHPLTEPVCVVNSKNATQLVRYEFLDAAIDAALAAAREGR